MSKLIRNLPVLLGKKLDWNPDAPPKTPFELFDAWFTIAVGEGVAEPHAMVLSTIDFDGSPDARVLILKDYDPEGFYFSIALNSPKGRQLFDQSSGETKPAAMTFYWKEISRQVRIRGQIELGDTSISKSDFAERSASAKAIALMSMQSAVLESEANLEIKLNESNAALQRNPDKDKPDWRRLRLRPTAVEFWQARETRLHQRLEFRMSDGAWQSNKLWP